MKILLIDDHKLIKIGIKVLLEDHYSKEVVEDCSTVEESIEKIKNMNYDLIICDISLSDGTGYDILKKVTELNINSKVLVLSMYEDKNYVKKALRLGARGYITKSNAHEEILTAIDRVMNNGEIYINKKYSGIFYELYQEKAISELSEREKEVAKYILMGYTLTEIGEKLFLSVKTIDTYKKRLMEKTNTKKRSELVEYLKHNIML
ncbi:two-component system response regulator [Gemella sp. oral taxon 928]|uniref:response regulator transcription factor n=1 Tax=Gemella sp. oral taxon 928 TaxID=1785995 RepID=UPI0007681539|nr:response regulator transcription factor [Gemella sp. oral taxon 928]AME09205.1 two-component system response regulator [Gemella sp. oral taxon 928]